MSKVIAVFNQKGGVGKTTTNVNLTASLGSMGKKILVLDLDPQGNTTSGYGIDKQSVERTIYDVIIEGVEINEAILSTEFDNIDIVASDTDLAGCEIELTSRESREYILKNSIDKVRDNYDYIFIDAPPIGIVTDAGIISTFTDGCIFVVGAGEADIEMAKVSKERLEKVGANILGVVLNKFESSGASGYYNYYYEQETKARGNGRRKK